MKYNHGKIRDLLNKSELLVVPSYQRDFVWNDTEGREFFEDVSSSDPKDGEPLFLGTFIFNEEMKRERGEIEVVDGQQRITTILIFLIACRVYVRERGFSPTIAENIQRLIISQSLIRGLEEKNPCRLKTEGRIGQALEFMSESDWKGDYEKKMGNKHGWNRIRKAYDFFYKELEDGNYDEKKIIKLFGEQLLDNVEYIEITVDNTIEAIHTFERVNARGQHLAVYDLMKAYLFAQGISDPELQNIEKDWEQIKEYAEHSDSKLKKILYSFYFSKRGYVSPSQLYRSLKNMAESNTKGFVDELKSFSKFYSIVYSGEDFTQNVKEYVLEDMGLKNTKIDDQDRIKKIAKSLYAIGLFKVVSVYPLIYSSLLSLADVIKNAKNDGKKEIDKWISLLLFLEHFTFVTTRIAHASQYGGRLEKLYGGYCEKFVASDVEYIKLVEELKNDFKKINISKVEFVEKFADLSYKSKNDRVIMYYVFDKLSTQGVHPGNITDLFTPDKYQTMSNNIEHFLPQKSDDSEEVGESKHAIGNLLVMHRKDNSRLGNKSPDEKVKELKKLLKDGKILNKPYIEDFIRFYEQDRGGKWNTKMINKRTEDIGKQIYDIVDYR